jgi:hypothetical protein
VEVEGRAGLEAEACAGEPAHGFPRDDKAVLEPDFTAEGKRGPRRQFIAFRNWH